MKARKEVEKIILADIAGWSSKHNIEIYTEFFKRCSDERFQKWMEGLRDGGYTLSVFEPNGSSSMTTEGNIKALKKRGKSPYKHITFAPTTTTPGYTTPNKMMVLNLPIRRPKQIQSKGIRVAKNDRVKDQNTGQVTGDSRAVGLTGPEVNLMNAMGMEKTLVGLMKYRGGDLGGNAALNTLLYRHGHVSQDVLEKYSTGVVSTKTLESYYMGMMLKTNLTSE